MNLFYIAITYIIISLLVASYFYVRSKKDKYPLFVEVWISSVLALLLLPLFLNSLGVEILTEFFADANDYNFLELLSYGTVVALAGSKVIVKILATFQIDVGSLDKLSEENKELGDSQFLISQGILKSKIEKAEVAQDHLSKILIDLKNAGRFILLSECSDATYEDIRILIDTGYVLTSRDSKMSETYRITKLGLRYLESLQI